MEFLESQRHILVIDDEPTLRAVISDVLTDEGYRVTVSGKYFEDLNELIVISPDLIVLDIMLSGQRSGIEVIRELKADPRTETIPIAVCTGATHLTDEIKAALTAWDCLLICKPFDIEDFIKEINECLARHHLKPIS